MLKHHIVVSLRLIGHLGESKVDEFKQAEDLPEGHSDAQALKLVLQQFCIDPLIQQQITWWIIWPKLLLAFLLLFILLINQSPIRVDLNKVILISLTILSWVLRIPTFKTSLKSLLLSSPPENLFFELGLQSF